MEGRSGVMQLGVLLPTMFDAPVAAADPLQLGRELLQMGDAPRAGRRCAARALCDRVTVIDRRSDDGMVNKYRDRC